MWKKVANCVPCLRREEAQASWKQGKASSSTCIVVYSPGSLNLRPSYRLESNQCLLGLVEDPPRKLKDDTDIPVNLDQGISSVGVFN